MYCPNCGSHVDDEANFCPECGMPLQESREALAENQDGSASDTRLEMEETKPEKASSEESSADDSSASKKRKAGVMAATVNIAGFAVPAFAAGIAGAVALGAVAYAVAAGTGALPSQQQESQTMQSDSRDQLQSEAHAAYDKVLDEYSAAYIVDYDTYIAGGKGIEEYPDVNWGRIRAFRGPGRYNVQHSFYAMIDIDGDGIDELFIGDGGGNGGVDPGDVDESGVSHEQFTDVYAAYDYDGNGLVTLWQASDSYLDRYILCQDNAVLHFDDWSGPYIGDTIVTGSGADSLFSLQPDHSTQTLRKLAWNADATIGKVDFTYTDENGSSEEHSAGKSDVIEAFGNASKSLQDGYPWRDDIAWTMIH